MSGTVNMYERLVSISTEAFAARSYETSYHALAAALHCAHDAGNEDLISDAGRRAQEQNAWIDTNDSAHTISTASARARGHESLFSSLGKQARTALLLVKSERLTKPEQNGKKEDKK